MLAITIALVLFASLASAETPCSHYAAPTGSGAVCTQTQPCQVERFWALAGPGKTLCLKDGEYRGASQMISPPPGLKGTQAAPITVRAEHDGGVLLDAQHQGFAVYIGWHTGPATDNAWFVVEGINAINGLEAVYSVSSSDTVLKRVIGWDGTSGANPYVFTITGYRSRAEDCAGWGMNVRKIMNGSQAGNLQGAGFRRCWAEWNDHPQGDSNPNNTYEIGYNTSNQLYENVIGTWDTKGHTGEIEGVFHVFGSNSVEKPHDMQGSKLLGSIAYTVPGQTVPATALVGAYGLAGMLIKDVAAVVSPTHESVFPFWFGSYMCTAAKPCINNRCENCLAVHAGTPTYIEQGSGWTLPGLRQGRGLAAATGGESAFTLLPGICREYVNGELTQEKLWPWKMDKRIRDARIASGYRPVTVTEEVSQALGPIPQTCMRDGTPPIEPPVEPPVPPATAITLSCVGLQGETGGIAIACQPQPAKR